jgi:hypothetical protein
MNITAKNSWLFVGVLAFGIGYFTGNFNGVNSCSSNASYKQLHEIAGNSGGSLWNLEDGAVKLIVTVPSPGAVAEKVVRKNPGAMLLEAFDGSVRSR